MVEPSLLCSGFCGVVCFQTHKTGGYFIALLPALLPLSHKAETDEELGEEEKRPDSCLEAVPSKYISGR